ncbi:hypothetical protein VPH35_033930 [Triticum aestivum]
MINDAPAFPQREKSTDASAMLLYEAPSGITLFSFDGGYLHDLVKDFSACLPLLSLVISMKYEKVPTPIDLVNEAIDDRLAKRLIKLCGSEKKLVSEAITCLYVEVPDCEVIIRSLKNPMRSVKINVALAMLLYQAPSGMAIFCFHGAYLTTPVKDFWASWPQLSLIVFIKVEKMPTPIDLVNEVIDGHLVKRLRQLCGSGRKLVVGSGITCLHVDVPDCEVIICSLNKPMCLLVPEEQFEPDKDLELFLHQRDFDVKLEMIFSFDECSKIEGHAPGYKRRFSKIDVLSIYKHVARLSSKKCILMVKLDIWITKAKEVREKADVRD